MPAGAASALLAVGLGADVLALATDVDAVYTGAGGSMGPKVEAVCRFVEATGKHAAIGQLKELSGLIDGTAGTGELASPPCTRP